MPFVSRTKGSKEMGIQTYARVVKLMPEVRDGELEYLSVRDWYMNTLAIKAQYEEALAQAKAANDDKLATEMGGKIHGVDGTLVDLRDRVRRAGEGSWAEAFYLCARTMLPKETMSALENEATHILGRPRHELSRGYK